MRIRSVYLVAYIVLAISCLAGCKSVVFDDLGSCPHGIDFKFYRQTPCELTPAYPSDIRQVRVFAFDEKDVLIGEFSDKGIVLSADYALPATFHCSGKLTFVAWGGSDLSAFDFSGFKTGVTVKNEMKVSLRMNGSKKIASAPGPLYVGLSSVVLENPKDVGSMYAQVKFNMKELTYKVHLTVESVGEPFPVDDEFVISIEDDNGVYDFNGAIASGDRFEYTYSTSANGTSGALKADFMLMKLEKGRNARLSITNKTTGDTFYTANLVEDIIMYSGQSGVPPYSLECDHDFPITLKLQYKDKTWMLVQATVLDWNVVSRPIEL